MLWQQQRTRRSERSLFYQMLIVNKTSDTSEFGPRKAAFLCCLVSLIKQSDWQTPWYLPRHLSHAFGRLNSLNLQAPTYVHLAINSNVITNKIKGIIRPYFKNHNSIVRMLRIMKLRFRLRNNLDKLILWITFSWRTWVQLPIVTCLIFQVLWTFYEEKFREYFRFNNIVFMCC